MANYSAELISVDGLEVVRLKDAARDIEVSIVPSIGNIAYEMNVRSHNLFWWPYQSLTEFQSDPAFAGNPFLAPWANRLDHDGFYANGKSYQLNPTLGNFRRDANGLPIHGLLAYSPEWRIAALLQDGGSAELTSRLEFWKKPEYMAQFPFAHSISITYRLSGGQLEVRLALENLATEPMPVSVAFHPYFQLTDAPRGDWKAHIPAGLRYQLSETLVPTGATTPADLPDPAPLSSYPLDDVFGEVNHAEEFWVEGVKQRISIRYGPKYRVAVVYAPPGKNFICFEPMSGITNAFNLAHAGVYRDLQSIAPDGQWEESYWIRPSGF